MRYIMQSETVASGVRKLPNFVTSLWKRQSSGPTASKMVVEGFGGGGGGGGG